MEMEIPGGQVNTFDAKYDFKPSDRSVRLTITGVVWAGRTSAVKPAIAYEGYMEDEDTLILKNVTPPPPPEETAGLKMKPPEPWQLSRKKTVD
jgi:hypothetical protein